LLPQAETTRAMEAQTGTASAERRMRRLVTVLPRDMAMTG
jgi:hypothetical protein